MFARPSAPVYLSPTQMSSKCQPLIKWMCFTEFNNTTGNGKVYLNSGGATASPGNNPLAKAVDGLIWVGGFEDGGPGDEDVGTRFGR